LLKVEAEKYLSKFLRPYFGICFQKWMMLIVTEVLAWVKLLKVMPVMLIIELEIVRGVLMSKLNANSGIDNNELLLNGDKGFLDDSSNGGDSDRGVRDGSNDGQNIDGKLFSNGILDGNSKDKVAANLDLAVMAVLLLGCPGGLCIKACCFSN